MTQWVIEHPREKVSVVGYPRESWRDAFARAQKDHPMWWDVGLRFRPIRPGESYRLTPWSELAVLNR